MRTLMTVAAAVAGLAASAISGMAQTPPPGARPPTANLRPIPDGPGKRVAELQGLDKVTARTQRFYAPVGQATRFGTLEITVGDCLVTVPEASPESVAYLTIVDHKPGQAEEKLFAGWMFASAPSLSACSRSSRATPRSSLPAARNR